ncbi:MAG: hypothetical protein M3461_15135 [Pseudomonadota bacterium]|nr:hypothetical protein [Pseudomonadota bacterium]
MSQDDIFDIGFYLGSACEYIKGSRKLNRDAEAQLMVTMGNQWLDGALARFFDKIADHNVDTILEQGILPWLSSIEYVEFQDSYLARRFSRDGDFEFQEQRRIDHSVQSQVKKDSVFRYGRACEYLLFARDSVLHYCFTPVVTTPNGEEYRWALCVWCPPEASPTVAGAHPQLQTQLRRAWGATEGAKDGGELLNLAEEITAARFLLERLWSRENGRLEPPDAIQVKRKVDSLAHAVQICPDVELVQRVKIDLSAALSAGVLVENISFDTLLRTLHGDTP